jgi:integrase
MQLHSRSVSGHVWLYKGKRSDTWYVKYRRQDGTQKQRRLGPAWTERGRPPAGYFTQKTAKAELQAILADARRGLLAQSHRTGVTFAHATEEWYEHGVHERGWKHSTRRDYRSALNVHLLPAFGAMQLETISARTIEAWRTRAIRDEGLPRRTGIKLVAVLHGIFERAHKLHALNANPVDDVERHRERYDPSSYDFYTAEEIYALARAASSEQDGAIFLVAAFTGLRRGELLALRWRDVDFEGEAIRVERSVDRRVAGTTKSGKGRPCR